MAIRDFVVGPLKGLVRAEAHELGNLVAIAGPNGAGKSSLLDSLRTNRGGFAEPGTDVLFMGPHRTWRSSNASVVSVYGYTTESFAEVLKQDNLPSSAYGMGQLQFLANMFRDSSSADDSQAFVKTSLIKLQNKQQGLVTRAFNEQGGEVASGSVPQLFEPMTRMVETLLPHLRWLRVDDSTPDNIRCLFELVDRPGVEFDIDSLSSGEKAAISMFLPFVEQQANQLINPPLTAPGVVPITMLLDEPEIHLHPSLQLQVLQYLRNLAAEGTAQFIVSTHSPTLLDSLDEEELWLLSPASLSPDNQLSRLSSSFEKLELARAITGSTHLLTRATPLVLVEGVVDKPSSAGDARLIKLLLPRLRHWSLLPSGGKSEVIRSVERLRSSELDVPGLPVFGLIDGDHGVSAGDDHVVEWPVAMIENLLLDPQAIFEVLQSLPSPVPTQTTGFIEGEIANIASSRRQLEIDLRVRADLPVGHLRVSSSEPASFARDGQQQLDDWLRRVEAASPELLKAEAEAEVDTIIAAGAQVSRFHGKEMLKELYGRLGPHVPLGIFSSLVASRLGGSTRIEALTLPAISRIQLYIPDLASALGAASPAPELTNERDELQTTAASMRAEWVSGGAQGEGRQAFRERLFAFARQLDGSQRLELTKLASQVGTP